jgi:hypothetical protein
MEMMERLRTVIFRVDRAEDRQSAIVLTMAAEPTAATIAHLEA